MKKLNLFSGLALSCVGFLMSSTLWAEGHPDFSGNWQLDAEKSELHSRGATPATWQIEQNEGTVHLVERAGDKAISDIRCSTDGKDYKIKDDGHAAHVSLYYNGPMLVEVETLGQNGDSVIKKRFRMSDDGSVLTVEVMHLAPAGKPSEKLVLTKASAPVSASASR